MIGTPPQPDAGAHRRCLGNFHSRAWARNPYKYAVKSRFRGYSQMKSDPYGFCDGNAAEIRFCRYGSYPRTNGSDQEWMEQARPDADLLETPLSVYEVHMGSWAQGRAQPAAELPGIGGQAGALCEEDGLHAY